jgi:hypothetical protein
MDNKLKKRVQENINQLEKQNSDIHSHFCWKKTDIKKPIKQNRVLCCGDDGISGFFIAYWSGKQWINVYGSKVNGFVEYWCYIKTPNNGMW